MKLKTFVSVAAVALLAACSSTKPTPVAMQPVMQTQEVQAPEWFNNPPASTKDVLYVTGTSNSVNYGSSRNKALLDAQVQLGDKLNGEMNALVQQYQNGRVEWFPPLPLCVQYHSDPRQSKQAQKKHSQSHCPFVEYCQSSRHGEWGEQDPQSGHS